MGYAGDIEGEDVIYKGAPANSNVTALVTGLTHPDGVAVDAAGNVYAAQTYNFVISKWTLSSSNLTTLVPSGLSFPEGVAVDGAGNVYIADSTDKAIKKWTAASNTVTTLPFSGLSYPEGVAVDETGNVYIANTLNNAIEELPYAFVDPTPRFEGRGAGSDAFPVVLPATENLLGLFAPTSDQPWLTITGITNGVVSFAFTANTAASRTAHVTVLGQTIPVTQRGIYSLASTALLEGPNAGTDSVVLAVVPNSASWTNTANAPWLHLSPANQSGTGATNVVFTYEANAGVTRTGTITIGDQMLVVTQAGSTYVAATPLTTLAPATSGLLRPNGVASDSAGNVYIADSANNAIKEWTKDNNTLTTLVSSGLNYPAGVAVDSAGNVYIADSGNNAIKVWTVANSNVTTLVSSGLAYPAGVAVDSVGNIYIADSFDNAIKEWTTANGSVTTLVSSGLDFPASVAVDGAGNVYIADTGSGVIKEWTAATGNLTTLVSSGLDFPYGVAVDGAGNVFIADTFESAIKKWTAATGNLTTLISSGLDSPYGVAVDSTGNVYSADSVNNVIKELPYAFVDPTARLEPPVAGNDALPGVLPATENLLAPFAPTNDQLWLTISGITNGVVGLSLTANTGPSRTAHITLLGQTIPITQSGPIYSLGTTALLEGPNGGSNSVVLAVAPNFATWTATTSATWLHLSQANQSGTGCTNVVFSYDANPGATRSGNLIIGGQSLTVTQAGSTYVAAGLVTTLVSSGLSGPSGVAVDAAGNLYIADNGDSLIKEWTVTNDTVTTLVSSNLWNPESVAVDGAGNVYIADTINDAIKEWTVANGNVITLYSGPNETKGVAVDSAGNVYFTDTTLNKWTVGNSNETTLVSTGLFWPQSVALDIAGNVYFMDIYYNTMQKWTASNSTATTLISSGLDYPYGVAVAGTGNVYIADTGNNAIKQLTAANGNVTTLVSTGLNQPKGVAVDGAGNIYIADAGNNAIKELPNAFVDPSAKLETAAAGNDSLPVVLPATANLLAPFMPTSDQSWLTISGITNGVVSFSFPINTGPSRTAHINLLGQTISITQGVIGTPPNLTGVQMLGNGAFQFSFTSTPGATFTVLSTTNLSLSLSNWTVVGVATNTAPGVFQFTTQSMMNGSQQFYIIRSP